MARTSSIALTDRDIEILVTLSVRARMLSRQQIARTWWRESLPSSTSCRHRLRWLERSGLLVRWRVSAIDVGELVGPVATWSLGRYIPDLGALSWLLRRRWRSRAEPADIYLATPRAAQWFGGRRRGRISRAFQVSHDLGVAAMFLGVRSNCPSAVERWIDEDRFALTRRGQKLPDAVIANRISVLPELVLEFGGDYSKARLESFHDDNESRGLSYEIW